MKTGIVILNYNDYENTMKMLEQIKDYKCLNKIVVVDNCSSDNSYDILKKYEDEKIIILKAQINKGYASGNNVGLKYLEENTDCNLVIISNPDIIVEEKTINTLIKDLKENKDISFIAPVINEHDRMIKGWKLPTFITDLVSNINYFSKYSNKMLTYKDDYYKETLTKVDVLHGCFFMARLSDFKKIEYFDEHTFLYYEENILGKKNKNVGLNSYVDTSINVKHELSKSVDKSLNKIKKYKILKKSQMYYEKYYNNLNIFGLLILKIMYYLSLGISYLTYWI